MLDSHCCLPWRVESPSRRGANGAKSEQIALLHQSILPHSHYGCKSGLFDQLHIEEKDNNLRFYSYMFIYQNVPRTVRLQGKIQ